MSEEQEKLVDVPMWDLPVRLFHWSFVAAFAVCWISGQTEDLDLHYASGMVLLGLLVFRVLWGLVGSPTARFSHFLRWPSAAIGYLRDSFGHPRPSYSYGHNAAGGLMVAALIALMALQTVSGMASTDDVLFDGPLYGRLPDWLSAPLEKYHELLANILLALALLHIAVIIFYRVLKRENLVRAMILGRARLPQSMARMVEQGGSSKGAPLWRALICAVIAAAVPVAIHLALMS
ncbi:MAG TPA: cytochrome b/b6 domain-containing protein [Dongiaceae bacterium]|jgi:cytochrome b|nr:cytochrome b/b6 domain-containing protein [Dongiaceae bacterium]